MVFTYVACIKRRGKSLSCSHQCQSGAPEPARDIEPGPEVGLAPVPRAGQSDDICSVPNPVMWGDLYLLCEG